MRAQTSDAFTCHDAVQWKTMEGCAENSDDSARTAKRYDRKSANGFRELHSGEERGPREREIKYEMNQYNVEKDN